MTGSVRFAAVLAAIALTAGACGIGGPASTHDTSKRSSLDKAAAQGNGMFGAIFTTDSSGTVVNGNIYTAKEDVYLNGGPRKEGAAGLPDGTYYYLITDPGCKEQLAGPTAVAPYNTSGKLITVENGEFTALMQLAPFADTPNNGGEYKVYVTAVENYDPDAKNACFGFVPRYTKTDNFKVREREIPPPPGSDTFCVSGKKCFDRNGNGQCDSQEGPVSGITIGIVDTAQNETTTTTSTVGNWAFCGLAPGAYHVHEVLPATGFWVQTAPAGGQGFDVTVTDHDIENLLFANVCHLDSLEGPVPADPEDCFPAEATGSTL